MSERYGRWVVLEPCKDRPRYYICECDCGTVKEVGMSNMRSGKSLSCGCAPKKDTRKRPYEYIYTSLLTRSAPRDIEVRLTYEEFVSIIEDSESKCHYCHAPIVWHPHSSRTGGENRSRGNSGYGIDRMNNEPYYGKDNSVACCGRCNWSKGSNFDYQEWMRMTSMFREEAAL